MMTLCRLCPGALGGQLLCFLWGVEAHPNPPSTNEVSPHAGRPPPSGHRSPPKPIFSPTERGWATLAPPTRLSRYLEMSLLGWGM